MYYYKDWQDTIFFIYLTKVTHKRILKMYTRKETERMDIFIEEMQKVVLVREKWKYRWKYLRGTLPWTYNERRDFHSKVDDLIWNTWGNRVLLKVEGNSDFAKKYKNVCWELKFDIQWVLFDEHWTVNVIKLPRNYLDDPRSEVKWEKKEINLDTKDVYFRGRKRSGGKYFQKPVVHEFGHTIGNVKKFNRGDEYKSISSYNLDFKSIMNVGNEIRDRHFWFVIEQLNTMIPDTKFIIS